MCAERRIQAIPVWSCWTWLVPAGRLHSCQLLIFAGVLVLLRVVVEVLLIEVQV